MSHSYRTRTLWISIFLAFVGVAPAMADPPTGIPRAVVELFTSQGCSSCPPADAVAGRLRTVPHVLILSFHVNYWDDLGWRDPFGSQASTDRQNAYARSLGGHLVFTPQVIVNGTVSLVGSREGAIQQAVAAADRDGLPVRVDLSRLPGGDFSLSLQGAAPGAQVWEIRYVRRAVTPIRGGENDGRTLETYNNVTGIRRLGALAAGTFGLPPLKAPDDGLAILVQAPGMHEVLGAAAL